MSVMSKEYMDWEAVKKEGRMNLQKSQDSILPYARLIDGLDRFCEKKQIEQLVNITAENQNLKAACDQITYYF